MECRVAHYLRFWREPVSAVLSQAKEEATGRSGRLLLEGF